MSAPPGYEAVRAVGARGFARPAAMAWVDAALTRWGTLARASSHEADAVELRGRGVVRAVPAPAGVNDERWVVRRYLRGGWAASVLHDRYLRRGTPRTEIEARASDAARERGVPTPEVQAGVTYSAGPLWYRADLVTSFVPHSVDLAGLLFENQPPARDHMPTVDDKVQALALAGRLARCLSEAGVYHADLNAKNILIMQTPDGIDAQVLDLDRARVLDDTAPLAPMAARLTRSLRKFETTTGVVLGERGWSAFLETTGPLHG